MFSWMMQRWEQRKERKQQARNQEMEARVLNRLAVMFGKANGDITDFSGFTSGLDLTKSDDVFRHLGTDELEDVYCKQAVVYAVVRKIYTALSEAPLKIGRETSDGFEEVPHHFAEVIKMPNPEMSWSDFIAHYVSHLLTTGKSYVWEIKNGAGLIEQIIPLPSSWVNEDRSSNGKLLKFVLDTGGGGTTEIEPEDMVKVWFPDPSNIRRACGPLQGAMRDVQTDDERENYMVEMLTNMKAPGMVLFQPDGWTKPQKDAAKRTLQNDSGRGARGGPLFLSGDNATFKMEAPLKDLDWPGLTSLSETRICSTFGVPPMIIGLRSGLEHGTFSNMETATRTFYQGTLPPLWIMLEDGFTRGFLFNEGESEDLVMRFDTSNIPELQENRNDQSERMRDEFTSGLITRNEFRGVNGYELLAADKGDVYLMRLGFVEVPAFSDGPIISPVPTLEDEGDTSIGGGSEEEEDGTEESGNNIQPDAQEEEEEENSQGKAQHSPPKKRRNLLSLPHRALVGNRMAELRIVHT